MRGNAVSRWPSLGVVVGGLLLVAIAVLDLLVLRDDPVRNGSIIHAGDGSSFVREIPRRLTGAARYPPWQAFDERTGSFLFVDKFGRVFVVDDDSSTSGFHCDDHPWPACELLTFGPGPGEVTLPVDDPGGLNFFQSAQVMALDGTVRDRLDLTAAVTASGEPALVEDLAWSPDGEHLAVSTVASHDCDPDRVPCEGRVWIFDRDGGEPRLVYSEAAPDELLGGRYPNLPVPGNLAWSPRGQRLGLVVASNWVPLPRGVKPRLLTVRLPLAALASFTRDLAMKLPVVGRPADGRAVAGQPRVAETLHVYGDLDSREVGEDYEQFAFAWSPDGTRIAVTTNNGIAELSAEDGHRLARHPGDEVLGPLAWLRER